MWLKWRQATSTTTVVSAVHDEADDNVAAEDVDNDEDDTVAAIRVSGLLLYSCIFTGCKGGCRWTVV